MTMTTMDKARKTQLRKWWKKYYVGRSKYRMKELEMWNDGVTFEDVYNLIRANGPQDPERDVAELVWRPEYSNVPYARQCLYRTMATIMNIHGGRIDLPWDPDYGCRGGGVDYHNFLTKWIHENND